MSCWDVSSPKRSFLVPRRLLPRRERLKARFSSHRLRSSRRFKNNSPLFSPLYVRAFSPGEYPALVAAGKLSFADALKIVDKRGTLMGEACARYPGTMRVVLGMNELQVQEAIGGIRGLWIANLNCPGQVVISGELAAVEKGAQKLLEAGAKRVLPLDVAGAFHSGLMEEAQQKLSPLIESATIL